MLYGINRVGNNLEFTSCSVFSRPDPGFFWLPLFYKYESALSDWYPVDRQGFFQAEG